MAGGDRLSEPARQTSIPTRELDALVYHETIPMAAWTGDVLALQG